MAQDSILLDKSLHFAARIVKLYRYLLKEKHEAIISKQLLRQRQALLHPGQGVAQGKGAGSVADQLPVFDLHIGKMGVVQH